MTSKQIQAGQDLLNEIDSYPTNELVFRIEVEIGGLIKWAHADLDHANESKDNDSKAEAKQRIRDLNKALTYIKFSYKD